MFHPQLFLLSAGMVFACALFAGRLQYPPARRSDQVDTYFGEKVADPYRWLEDVDSPETRQWIEAENKLTFSYLDSIPQRESVHRSLTNLYNYERYSRAARSRAAASSTRTTPACRTRASYYYQDGVNGPRMC